MVRTLLGINHRDLTVRAEVDDVLDGAEFISILEKRLENDGGEILVGGVNQDTIRHLAVVLWKETHQVRAAEEIVRHVHVLFTKENALRRWNQAHGLVRVRNDGKLEGGVVDVNEVREVVVVVDRLVTRIDDESLTILLKEERRLIGHHTLVRFHVDAREECDVFPCTHAIQEVFVHEDLAGDRKS
jgi:hypothetical protein